MIEVAAVTALGQDSKLGNGMRGNLKTIFTAAWLAAVLFVTVAPVLSAQPAPAGRGGRGGGFREPDPIDFNDHSGWTSMFDGRTLSGWDGDKSYWHVQDGAIVVES